MRVRNLPTVFQWNHVAGFDDVTAAVVPLANFAGRGTQPTAESRALHRFGAYDLAGNVKEWAFNESSPGHHYLLGGAWDEAAALVRLGRCTVGLGSAAQLWVPLRSIRRRRHVGCAAQAIDCPAQPRLHTGDACRRRASRRARRAFSYDRTAVESRIEASNERAQQK